MSTRLSLVTRVTRLRLISPQVFGRLAASGYHSTSLDSEVLQMFSMWVNNPMRDTKAWGSLRRACKRVAPECNSDDWGVESNNEIERLKELGVKL